MQNIKLFFILSSVLVRNICCNCAVAEILSTLQLKNYQDSDSKTQIQLQPKEGNLLYYNEGRSHSKKIYSHKAKLKLTVKQSSINKMNVRPFCNRHAGQTGILLGSGPTLKKFLLDSEAYDFQE